ncbi:MAG: hypothetical protein KIT31_30655 [Deltaproteobacteria bacterium]|nr:hypothetical protein [Deltaproteobacteria bacterium]
MNAVLYAGPTLARARALRPQLDLTSIDVMPPIARGDLPKLVRARPPGTLIVVDGRFHQVLAVGHIELRDAIAAGWSVWGLSSLGAIRAHELRDHGMRGFGRVFDLYTAPGDFRDDEVTLLHELEPPYRELSEPLVHLRLALHALASDATITLERAGALVAELEHMYFGDRTLAWMRAQLAEHHDAFLAHLDASRIKALDLIDFLGRRPWLDGSAATAG